MVLTTIALAASLGMAPAPSPGTSFHPTHPAVTTPLIIKHDANSAFGEMKPMAVDLHPMTDEEKKIYPGREHWDKTEWYEAQFKSAKIVILPEHVDEWNNGGIDVA